MSSALYFEQSKIFLFQLRSLDHTISTICIELLPLSHNRQDVRPPPPRRESAPRQDKTKQNKRLCGRARVSVLAVCGSNPCAQLFCRITCSSAYPTVSQVKSLSAGAGEENLDMPRRSHQYAVDEARSETLNPTEANRSFRPSIGGMALYL